TVRAGRVFTPVGPDEFAMNPGERSEYPALLKALREGGRRPQFIVHLWGLTAESDVPLLARVDEAETRGFYSLLFLAQAIASADTKDPVQVAVVTNGMQEVAGGELTCPEKATVVGPCRVIPQELSNVTCRSFDVDLRDSSSPE